MRSDLTCPHQGSARAVVEYTSSAANKRGPAGDLMKIDLAGGLDAIKFWQDVRTALERSLPTDIERADWTLRIRPFEDENDDEVELGRGEDWSVEANANAEFITVVLPADGEGDLEPKAAAKLIVSLVHDATDDDDEDDDDADEDDADDRAEDSDDDGE